MKAPVLNMEGSLVGWSKDWFISELSWEWFVLSMLLLVWSNNYYDLKER